MNETRNKIVMSKLYEGRKEGRKERRKEGTKGIGMAGMKEWDDDDDDDDADADADRKNSDACI